MKTLTYIYHDCFVFEDPERIIVFDYWKDPVSDNQEEPAFIKLADKRKHLFVLVSHHHKDHYTPKIFAWERLFSKATFILSHDTARFCRHILKKDSVYNGIKPDPENVVTLSPGESFETEDIKIKAFGSTDIGNSYIVKIKEEVIFHAGDLNAWIWKDESTHEEVEREIKRFRDILEKIAMEYPEIEIAMFPVDARIGTDYFTGAKILLKEIYVKRFFPMHFALGEDEVQSREFKNRASDIMKYANPERGEYICLLEPYSVFGQH